MRVVCKRRAKIPQFYFMGPKILFFRFSTFFFYFLCLLRLFCLFTYTIMCISTFRWVLFRNAILVHSAMSYKHFKVWKNARVVSALVCGTEVVGVMSSAPHSSNHLLHIFLCWMVPDSSLKLRDFENRIFWARYPSPFLPLCDTQYTNQAEILNISL